MGYTDLKQRLKSFGAFLLILLLLPYVVTVFINGANINESKAESDIYVKVRTTSDTEEDVIEEVPWTEYFIGVLAREVPEDAEPEFMKAQAVVIRTQLYRELEGTEDKVLTERYLTRQELEDKLGSADFESYYTELLDAMEMTADQVLFYQDTYAWTPFHQSSNGTTRSAVEVLGGESWPYLQVRECPQDKEAEDEMQFFTFEYRDIQEKCKSFLVALSEEEMGRTYDFSDFEILSYDSAGYVSQFRIGETVCTGDQFRDALSLPSSAFSIKDADGLLKIATRGKGHGLGMSQWTAQSMAKDGKTYEEILQYFFEGTNLKDGGEIFTKME